MPNLNFHGTQFLSNIDYGINQNQTGVFAEINLVVCSLDYNGQFNSTAGGQVALTNGKLNVLGGHFENNVLPMISIPTPGAAAVAAIYVEGTNFNLVDATTSHTYTSFFNVKGDNNVLELGRGVTFGSAGAVVSAVVNWAPIVNQNSRVIMDPYTYNIGGTDPTGLAAVVGTAPNDYSYPIYDVHDNITSIHSSFPYN